MNTAIKSVKEILVKSLPDISKAPSGEMSLFSESRNIRVQVTAAKKVQKSAYSEFVHNAEVLKPALALFISTNDVIPFNIQTSPCLSYYLHIDDLNERILSHIEQLPIVKEIDQYSDYDDYDDYGDYGDYSYDDEYDESEEDKSPKSKKSLKKSPTPKKSPTKTTKTSSPSTSKKESFIDKYPSTATGFEDYCSEVPNSKVEYTKAKSKWPAQMKEYKKAQDFKDYISSLKGDNDSGDKAKHISGAVTLEEFTKYLLSTPASKLRIGYIKEQFGNLEEAKMNLSSIKDFQRQLKENATQ